MCGEGLARAGTARIVFCAEQGFVGGFAEHVLEAAAARGPGDVFLIGSRGLLLAESHGIEPVWQSAMATQVGGIAGLCIRIAEALYERMATHRIGAVEVVFPAWTLGVGVGVTCRSLLPLDARRFGGVPAGMPPLTTLPPEELLASLAEEYVFASLCEAAMHAFVAENEARAAAMVRARSKVQDMLEALTLDRTSCAAGGDHRGVGGTGAAAETKPWNWFAVPPNARFRPPGADHPRNSDRIAARNSPAARATPSPFHPPPLRNGPQTA